MGFETVSRLAPRERVDAAQCGDLSCGVAARFRLRFLLQEFDLPPGETLVGRSPDCHITIEDPLISRQHARIVVTSQEATLEDLGSRNGSKVNGRPVVGRQVLSDGDRVRFGAQEMLFLRVGVDQRLTRSTGAMRLCSRCKVPFPEGPTQCPHCGHAVTAVAEEDTMSGISVPVRRTWILQMLGEVLDRAIQQGRVAEGDKLLRRVAEEAESRLTQGEIDTDQLERISHYAVRIAQLRGDAHWVVWVLNTHRRVQRVPAGTVCQQIEALRKVPGVAEAVQDYLSDWEGRGMLATEEDAAGLAALERVVEPTLG
jgi:uncharacterized Zn finger protein (UPF0148 family)